MQSVISLSPSLSLFLQSAMDAARLSAAKSSPMMETINMCLQHLDVSVLGELVPRLCELLKSGVGLGTKVTPSLTNLNTEPCLSLTSWTRCREVKSSAVFLGDKLHIVS